ncbi:MAG TPA: hypothetical protein VG247_11995 [Pseudonocardiaceae bacterium]|jgi:hypothetical protein|nr:hypothetical protein [Pseudonocardiaceae bacterium]
MLVLIVRPPRRRKLGRHLYESVPFLAEDAEEGEKRCHVDLARAELSGEDSGEPRLPPTENPRALHAVKSTRFHVCPQFGTQLPTAHRRHELDHEIAHLSPIHESVLA